MPRSAATDQLAAKPQAIYGEIGRKVTLEGSGGVADASVFAGVGITALDAFGIVGGGIRTPDEYAEVEGVVPRLYLVSRVLIELAGTRYVATEEATRESRNGRRIGADTVPCGNEPGNGTK